MKLTKKTLIKLIKEEYKNVVENDDVVPGSPHHEEDPPHGSIRAWWSGTPEEGIIELDDGTTIVVHAETDQSRLQTVADLLADKGIKSIQDSVNRGAPEEVMDFLKTKHLAGDIAEGGASDDEASHDRYNAVSGKPRLSAGQRARAEKEAAKQRAAMPKTDWTDYSRRS